MDSESNYIAKSLEHPKWCALRLSVKTAKATLDAESPYWVWMFPPEHAQGLKNALGELAWGRDSWQDLFIRSIANGVLAHFIDECGSIDHMIFDMVDNSYDSSFAKEMDPLTGIAILPSTNQWKTPATARPCAMPWASLEIARTEKRLLGYGPDETALWIDERLRRIYGSAIAMIGPLDESSYAHPYQGGHGEGFLELIPQAQAIIEQKSLSQNIKPGHKSHKAPL